jgi:beta-N-acetylhexosaminidase
MRLRLGLIAGGLLVLALSILSLAHTSSSPARQSSHKITSRPRGTPTDPAAKTPRRSQTNPRHRKSRLPIAPATVMTSPSQAAVPVSPRAGSAANVSVARMVGQQLMVRMTGVTPDGDLLARIRAGQVGGIILYGDDIESASQLRTLVAELQAAAQAGGNPPLLISTDQEGGEVKRLPWAAPTIAPPQIGANGPVVAESQGHDTGIALHAAGINVDLAPVADVAHSTSAFIWQQQRSFGMDPGTVTASTLAFARGLESSGVAPTAKHFPGLGAALTDTDFELQRLQLSAKDLAPYHALIPARIPLIMVSTAFYTNLDSSNPAALSKTVISGLLRHDLGYRGVVMTDDLQRPTGQSTAQAAVRADQAGADIILVSTTEDGGLAAYDALLSAAGNGQVSHAQIAGAYQRILALKARYALR